MLSRLVKSPLILFTTLLSPLTVLPATQGSGYSTLPAAHTSLDPMRTLGRALVRRPGDYDPWAVGIAMCLCICLYVCLYVSLCVLLCL